MINKVVTSLRTPLKGETSATEFSILEHDEYSGKMYRTSSLGSFMVDKYKPSGYILKIELSLTKIGLILLRCMHLILKNEMKQGPSSNFIKELSYYHKNTNETKLFMICISISDCVKFSLHCLKKWIKSDKSILKLNKVLGCSSKYTDNLLESHIDIFDALEISISSSELGLLLCMLLLKAGQMSTGDVYERGFLELADERLIEKIKSCSEDCKSVYADKDRFIREHHKANRMAQKLSKSSLKNTPSNEKDKTAKTNADVIIDKISKEYTDEKNDGYKSLRY
uniref:Uncharacterized protein n=1 Tax=Euplotes harpa TaxID=151035 RepID=A0A7S3NAH7_9SPIT|mmetsp:Transcript_30273/g.34659  ORF Transcript_30273/g.34659 Transcript_30273/m.34659 type:complete len:282 (+) Transcript_30273:182-1027(+)